MKKTYNDIFKTAPKKSFKKYLQESISNDERMINEAKFKLRRRGYKVLNEGKLAKFIAGVALSLGLITNAQAGEFNAQASTGYTSKATTSSFAKSLQKNYNMDNDVALTDQMVQNIADMVGKKISEYMLEHNMYDASELTSLDDWENAVEFYKTLNKQDSALANMFSRRLDKALTKSLGIAPNIQKYAS